jgi:hypothetical protein
MTPCSDEGANKHEPRGFANCESCGASPRGQAFWAWARIEMNCDLQAALGDARAAGGIRPLRLMTLKTRATRGCSSSSCWRPLCLAGHRPEHQHLFLTPLVDLTRGDLAAVGLGQHQEQVGIERLLHPALHLGEAGDEDIAIGVPRFCRWRP